MSACGTAPGFDETNCVVARGAKAKIRIQPVDEARTVMYLVRFDRAFEAVRIAVGASRECRRQPVLQPDQRPWRDVPAFTAIHRARSSDAGPCGRGRCTRRLRAERLPDTSRP